MDVGGHYLRPTGRIDKLEYGSTRHRARGANARASVGSHSDPPGAHHTHAGDGIFGLYHPHVLVTINATIDVALTVAAPSQPSQNIAAKAVADR